jgi:hypothetical protein
MLSRFQRLNSHLRVEIVRDGDNNCLDVRLLEQLAVVIVGARQFEPIASLLRSLRVGFRNGHRDSAGTGLKTEKMLNSNCARADNGTT